MTEGNRPKFSYLKKGVGQARYIKRNAILNPPPPNLSSPSSSDKTKTSTHSLSLIENLSPITKEPVINVRPTTAETNDSGVRDINLQISPSNDSGSVRTTVTTYHRESPQKPPIQDEANQTNESFKNEYEKCFQRFHQLAPVSARLAEEIDLGLDSSSSTASHTNSFTSLDRIKTPPIAARINANQSPPAHNFQREANESVQIEPQTNANESNQSSDFSAAVVFSSRLKDSSCKQNDDNIILRPDTSTPSHTKSVASLDRIKTPPIQPQTNANESDEQSSNFSAEIVASSRSKDSASVGTSRIHEFAHNDSVATLRANIDSNSRLHGATAGTSHSHQNRPYPTTHSQNDDQETPLNSRSRPPLFKSSSYGSLPYSTRRLYIDQIARRVIPTEFHYELQPRPKLLESPTAPPEFGTPQAHSMKNNNIFLGTPILPEKVVNKEGGKVVESLAEQLRALILCFDAGMDGRNSQVKQLKYLYVEKAKALKRKEQEMKEKMEAEKKKILGANAKLKLETDKIKESDGTLKNLENELKEVKSKFVDTSRNFADIRQAKNQLEQRLKKAEEELQKEKEKAQKWGILNGKLSDDLRLERRKAKMTFQQHIPQPTVPPPREQRQPFHPIPPQKQFEQSIPKSFETIIPPVKPLPRQQFHQQQQQSHHQFHPQQQPQKQFQPPQRKLTNTSTSSIESPTTTKNVHWSSPIEEHLTISSISENFSSLRIFIPEDAELVRTINNPLYDEEQYFQFGDYRIMKECKCESLRYPNGDIQYCCLNDVNVNGKRCEYFNLPNGQEYFVDIIVNEDEGKRQYSDGRIEILENMNTKRNENDFVKLSENTILFCCPGFSVARHLDKDFGGAVTVRVLTEDPQKLWKITICPEHRVFYVKHYNGNTNRRCFYTERRCDHLRN
uniref:Uncharacterized protein n=1 Tax=Panagrolaimus sp. ES5 TaxID=591445 RepID=A0AC34F605_9BILA